MMDGQSDDSRDKRDAVRWERNSQDEHERLGSGRMDVQTAGTGSER